jgi:hypothetical protein
VRERWLERGGLEREVLRPVVDGPAYLPALWDASATASAVARRRRPAVSVLLVSTAPSCGPRPARMT